jgi:exocyst complex component 2
LSDAKVLHELETWQASSSVKGATKYLLTMEDFQTRVLASSKKIATRAGDKEPVPASFKRRIKENFVDTLCFLFDGMLSAATAPPDASYRRRPSRVAAPRPPPKSTVCILNVDYKSRAHPVGYPTAHDVGPI